MFLFEYAVMDLLFVISRQCEESIAQDQPAVRMSADKLIAIKKHIEIFVKRIHADISPKHLLRA